MRKLFIETYYQGELELPEKLINDLPHKIVLAMPVQFLNFKEVIIKKLNEAGKKVSFFSSKHGKYPGQILGCDTFKYSSQCDAFLYIGDGKFHPTALLYSNHQPVYCYNPLSNAIEILNGKYFDKLQKKKEGQLAKFFDSKVVGILVSTKPGQNRPKEAEKLRERLNQKGKEAYLFLADTIDFNQLGNFNFIECWINAACPRIVEDFNCLNLDDLKAMKVL